MIIDFLIALSIFSIFTVLIIVIVKSYKTCPADKILVVYGVTGNGKGFKSYYGGATFVKPIIQSAHYFDLNTFESEIDETVFDIHNFPVSINAELTFGINTHPDYIDNAVERLLGRPKEEIKSIGITIIREHLKGIFANMTLTEILLDKEKLLTQIYDVENELAKLGLKLIGFNLKKVSDKYSVSEKLTKEIEKSINLNQIGGKINADEYKSKLSKIDNRLKDIEIERNKLLSEKIDLYSKLKE